MKRFGQVLSVLFLALLLTAAPVVRAQTVDVEISGNGAGSDNQANVEVKNETSVQSTNTADVANNVDLNSNTGGNTANANTGDQTQIQTGDATENLTIENNVNSQSLDLSSCGDCQSDLNVEVSGNGADSQNSVNTQIENSTNIIVENQAWVQNNVSVSANTGRNEASQNSGAVEISTGNISVDGAVINRVNISSVRVDPQGNNGNIEIKNIQNGANSVNDINVKIENEVNIEKINFAVVENDIDIQANTGENIANENLGDIEISTGNIDIDFEIINDPVNADIVFVDPCCSVDPSIPPEDVITPPPGQVAAAEVSPSSSSSSSEGSSGAALGIASLPNTGPSSFLILTLGWLLLYLCGRKLQIVAAKQERKFRRLSAGW